MVRFTVLASGSKGNSAVVSGGRTRILVDAGLSCRELFRRMKLAGEEPQTLDAIVITHEHQDHINGLAVTARKLGIPVYFTEATHRAWMRWLTPRRQMTYAQWLEQCRRQQAERQAEIDAAASVVDDLEELGQEDSSLEDAGLEDSGHEDPSHKDPGLGAETANPEANASARSSGIQPKPADEPAESQSPALRVDPTWLPAVEYFEAGQAFCIGDIDLSPFTI